MATTKATPARLSPQDRDRLQRQRLFLENIVELKRTMERAVGIVSKLEEIATSGNPSTDAVWADWVRLIETKTGEVFRGNKAAGKRAVRKLLDHHTADDVRARMLRFVAEADQWTARNGYPIDAMVKQFAALGASYTGPAVASEARAAAYSDAGMFDDEP